MTAIDPRQESTVAPAATRPAAAGPAAVDVSRLRRRFAPLDGLRAVGALMVVVTHVSAHTATSVTEPFGGLLARFDAGVALFFVISGFLLYRPYVAARLTGAPAPDVRGYLWRRALRILPVLWIAVAGVWLLFDHGTPASQYLRHALLVHIYWPSNWVLGLTQMWSLAVEAAFYVALPLLAWLLVCSARDPLTFIRRSLAVLGLLVLLSPVWVYVATALEHPTAPQWLPAYLGWFAIGMALVTWQQARGLGLLRASRIDDLARHPGTLWLIALAILVIVATPIAGSRGLAPAVAGEAAFKNLAYAVFAALLVLPCIAALRDGDDARVARALGGRVGRWLGDISYGIFAYHLLILELIGPVAGHENFTGGFWRLLVPTLLVTVPVAAISYRFLERPIMDWGRRVYSRR
ncbi:acyltransferase family protein [Ornithinimicrobium cryptoxanthini]|uniref:Acyltransferase n=1 Tax=Ornithinimicrobium cryptoxanthini TaxID=2934161 RepID=A0ABY4YII0_9MICO|nr:acyltransferase [Ornithinimicrobium cryptoxanthini]USQ76414.1 acyltransferase [Ornithinimicrobium cryptoxanthini]